MTSCVICFEPLDKGWVGGAKMESAVVNWCRKIRKEGMFLSIL